MNFGAVDFCDNRIALRTSTHRPNESQGNNGSEDDQDDAPEWRCKCRTNGSWDGGHRALPWFAEWPSASLAARWRRTCRAIGHAWQWRQVNFQQCTQSRVPIDKTPTHPY